MTLIGPRPEVPRFVGHYTDEERATLLVRPGLIGPGGLLFVTEQSTELDQVENPDLHYLRNHLHPKLAADLAYLRDRRLLRDLQVVVTAAAALIGRPPSRSGATTPAFRAPGVVPTTPRPGPAGRPWLD
jgi:lipopolysaccharide/colanic/teichoic acid biosynthesis glycosyltransferase